MKNKKKIVITLLAVILLIFSIISVLAGNYLVNYALKVEEDGYIASMGSNVYDGIQDTNAQKVYDIWVNEQEIYEWETYSDDGLKLYAKYYKANDDHKYIIAVHGYTCDNRDIAPAIVPFVDNGYNVLTIDQRGRGNSEGNYISMGYFEKDDVLKWIAKIIEYDPNAKIVLYGESMGAATIMMASSEDLPANVIATIEDCGYTSAYAMFKDQLKERFNLPEFPFLVVANIVGRFKAGFFFSDASPIKALEKASLPILFIHGAADDYVPTYMGIELYESYAHDKELLLVENATHGASSDVDPDLYYSTIFNFLAKYGF